MPLDVPPAPPWPPREAVDPPEPASAVVPAEPADELVPPEPAEALVPPAPEGVDALGEQAANNNDTPHANARDRTIRTSPIAITRLSTEPERAIC
jgi:hypothetical protein